MAGKLVAVTDFWVKSSFASNSLPSPARLPSFTDSNLYLFRAVPPPSSDRNLYHGMDGMNGVSGMHGMNGMNGVSGMHGMDGMNIIWPAIRKL